MQIKTLIFLCPFPSSLCTPSLYSPWDFDIKDTKEQVQLIIHMWIGLFYSRSTARFCQADSSLTCLEKKDSIEVAHGMVPAQVPPGTKTSSPAYIDLSRIPEPDVLDLSKMGQKKAQPLSLEAEVLDLSMKTTSTVLDSLDTESKRRIDLKNHPSYLPATVLHKETISCPKQSTSVELKVGKQIYYIFKPHMFSNKSFVDFFLFVVAMIDPLFILVFSFSTGFLQRPCGQRDVRKIK